MEDTDRPRRPTAIVDGRNGSIVMSWNAMTTFCPDATGIGGNGKVRWGGGGGRSEGERDGDTERGREREGGVREREGGEREGGD